MMRAEAERAALVILRAGFLVGFLRTTAGGIIVKVVHPMKGSLLGESGVARLSSTGDVERWLHDHPQAHAGPSTERKETHHGTHSKTEGTGAHARSAGQR